MENNFPTEAEIQQAIAAAVLAERKRVWDILSREIDIAAKRHEDYVPPDHESDTTEDVLFGRWAGLYDLRLFKLFPNGEPTTEESSVDGVSPDT